MELRQRPTIQSLDLWSLCMQRIPNGKGENNKCLNSITPQLHNSITSQLHNSKEVEFAKLQ